MANDTKYGVADDQMADETQPPQVAFPLVVYSATFVLGLLGNILILVAVGSQNQVFSLVLVLKLVIFTIQNPQ